MKKILLISLFFLLVVPLVNSAVEVQINEIESRGLDIIYTPYETTTQHRAFELITHVFNRSDGLILSNTTTSCKLHIYYSNGSEAIEVDFNYSDEAFNAYLPSSYFSVVDFYGYNIHCNSSGEGGFVSGIFDVTPSGRSPPTEGEAMIFIATFFVMIFFSILFFALSLQFKPSKDVEKSEDGSYNPIPNDKPALRFGFIALSLIIAFTALLYSMVILQEVYVGFDNSIDSFYTFMWVIGFVYLIIFIFVLVSLLIQVVDSLRAGRGLKDV